MTISGNDRGLFYSLKFKINSIRKNLYYDLIERYITNLKSTELILSTINYDCLIELACFYFDENITYWAKNKGIKLLKLHGSCNFIKTDVSGKGGWIMNKGPVEGALEFIHPSEVEERMDNCPLPSAMSLYARGKKVIIATQQINQMINEYRDYVMKSKLVIIIGVNPNPNDEHIWDPLRETEANVILIGNEKSCMNWLNENRNKKGKWISNTFFDGFDEICELLDGILIN